jgi:hypothetical protein
LQLQIKEIQDSLKHTEFEIRKNRVKIKRLNALDELESIEIEELEWGINNSQNLVIDALNRLENFLKMRTQLLYEVPQEYWDAGYEAAELEHWTNHFSNQLSLETMSNGAASLQTVQQIMLLPKNVQSDIFRLRDATLQQYAIEHKSGD